MVIVPGRPSSPAPTPAQRRRKLLLGLALMALIAVLVAIVAQTWGTQIVEMAGRQGCVVLGGVVFIVLALLWVGYTHESAAWIGLAQSRIPKDDKHDVQRTKTLWDWMDLLIIPAVLAAGGLWFTQQQQMQVARIADDRAKDAVLDTYMDRMSDLLLKWGLRNSKRNAVALAIAQGRTTTAIHRLDGPRNGILLTFLSRSGIVKEFDLFEADLRRADLRGADASCCNGGLPPSFGATDAWGAVGAGGCRDLDEQRVGPAAPA